MRENKIYALVQNNRKMIYFSLVFLLSAFAWFCVKYQGTDFYTYFAATKAFHENARPYVNLMAEGYLYYYPPLTAQLIWPLVALPPQWAYGVWFLISAMTIPCAVYLLVANKKLFPVGVLIAFGFTPVTTSLYAGQVIPFLFLALSLVYYAVAKHKFAMAGFGIATGIMLKVIPIAHFFYLLWRGKIKIVLAALVFLLLLAALSLPFAGWQGWVDFFHLAGTCGNPGGAPTQGFIGAPNLNSNQAISGLAARFTHNEFLAVKIWHISAIFMVIATGLVCWPKKNFSRLFDLEFSVVTLAINLIMPYTWYYQLMLSLIPLLIILQRLETDEFFRKLLPILIAGYLLTDFHGAFWHHLHNPVWASVPTFFSLFLWGSLSYKIVSEKAAVDTERRFH